MPLSRRSSAALAFSLLVFHPCVAFRPLPQSRRKLVAPLFAKKRAGQKQADLLRQVEEAKRKATEAPSSAPETSLDRPLEPPRANKDWRQGAAAPAEETYDEMEALLGQVGGISDTDVTGEAGALSGDVEPQDAWRELLDAAGAPVSWLDAVVRGGPIFVIADPRGGKPFAAIIRDLNSKVSANFPGSVVAITVDPYNDLRKLAKKSQINLEKIMLLSDPTKAWLLAHKCVGPQVTRFSTRLFVIQLRGGGGVIDEVLLLDDPVAAADTVVRKMSGQ